MHNWNWLFFLWSTFGHIRSGSFPLISAELVFELHCMRLSWHISFETGCFCLLSFIVEFVKQIMQWRLWSKNKTHFYWEMKQGHCFDLITKSALVRIDIYCLGWSNGWYLNSPSFTCKVLTSNSRILPSFWFSTTICSIFAVQLFYKFPTHTHNLRKWKKNKQVAEKYNSHLAICIWLDWFCIPYNTNVYVLFYNFFHVVFAHRFAFWFSLVFNLTFPIPKYVTGTDILCSINTFAQKDF